MCLAESKEDSCYTVKRQCTESSGKCSQQACAVTNSSEFKKKKSNKMLGQLTAESSDSVQNKNGGSGKRMADSHDLLV